MNKSIAIVTGWTDVRLVERVVNRNTYATVGNLYNAARGINLLIRSLLANKNIIYVVCLLASKYDYNAGSINCLVDFFYFGFRKGTTESGRECWVINSDVTGYIDLDIPEERLNTLRGAVTVYWFKDIYDLNEQVRLLQHDSKPWGECEIFPIPKQASIPQHGHLIGSRVEGATISDTWVKLLHRVRSCGQSCKNSYNSTSQEVINIMSVITDEPEELHFTDYLPVTKEFIDKYINQIIYNNENDMYSYGTRMRSYLGLDQIESVINTLRQDRNSNRGVISLWYVGDCKIAAPPCLNHVWLKISQGKLLLTATLRSNDIYSAWVSNAMGLRGLQRYIYNALKEVYKDIEIGSLVIVSQSAHIYEDCWNSADEIIAKYYKSINHKKQYTDPVGNFIISCGDDSLCVEQVTSLGELMHQYSGKNAIQLAHQIITNNPGILPDHSLYLGLELQKAEHCLKFGIDYKQC